MRQLRNAVAALLAIAAVATAIGLYADQRANAQQGGALSDILIAIRSHFPFVPSSSAISEATPVNASSGNVAAAVATATLPAVAGRTTYLSGFDINGGGATAGSIINCTVTGPLGGTLTYPFAVIAGALLGNSLPIRPPAPIPGSAVNTALVVSCPSFGAGNTNAAINAYGFNAAN